MKILFYNWARVDSGQGGGAAVYQRNLIEHLLKYGVHDLYFLNAGVTYVENVNQVGIVKIPNTISENLKTFEIVNSPVLAPVKQSIINVRHYLEDTSLYFLIKNFIESLGGVDVIHFNNLEGLSLSVLKLKEDFPKTKFVYSLHNYFLVCTQVSMWQTEKNFAAHNCTKKDYAECACCYGKINYNAEILSRKFAAIPAFKSFAIVYTQHFPDVDDVKLFREFEERNIFYVNKYVDATLAVSKRVKEIFLNRGLNERKLHLSYIGTDVAELSTKNKADINATPFKIIYIGYMNQAKGFYFFLEALYKMPTELAKNIVVKIVAKHDGKQREIDAINNLKGKFHEVILLNGYKRDELADILRHQNLGVVPVLWEDNLPQVAIEQIAYGVPILCSNLGGASELHNDNPNFTFVAGNIEDFLNKISNILANRILLKNYWKTVPPLTTMSKHVKFLKQIYEN